MYDHIIPKRVTIHKLSKSTLTVYIMSQRLHSDAEWFEILIKSKNELLNFDLFWCLSSSLDLKASEKAPQMILELSIAFLEIFENLHLLHKMGDFGKFTRHGVPCLLYSGIRVVSTPS